MKRGYAIAAAVALAAMPAVPAAAGWKLVNAGAPTAVAKSSLTVTAGQAWNRWSVRPIKKGEVWTLDGVNLNELYFVSGLAPGETLYRDLKKKDHPLPALGARMQLTDIPDFVESSVRVELNTSVFTMKEVQPTKFAGRDGVRFTYEYAVEGSPLVRRGLGAGTIVNGTLDLILYTAPGVYFYDRDAPKVEAIIASARL
jgi:hypothetical protein